jgi:hypothetical protein
MITRILEISSFIPDAPLCRLGVEEQLSGQERSPHDRLAVPAIAEWRELLCLAAHHPTRLRVRFDQKARLPEFCAAAF